MGKKSYILYFTQTYLLTLQPYYESYLQFQMLLRSK